MTDLVRTSRHPARSDPIRWSPPTEGAGGIIGCVVLFGGLLAAALGGVVLALDGAYAAAVGVLACFAAPVALWMHQHPRARLVRAVERSPHVLKSALSPTNKPWEIHFRLGLARRDPPLRFDPADAEQYAAMQALWRSRTLDGAAFEVDDAERPHETGQIRIPVRGGEVARRPIQRVVDWHRLVPFVAGSADPTAAWLGAMACTEQHHWQRATTALELLDARGAVEVKARVLDWLSAHGPHPARVAAALMQRDAGLIDRVLDGAPHGDPSTLDLMEARWGLAPDPAALERWAAHPPLQPMLARLDLPGAGIDHWQRLTTHPRIDIALIAAQTALDAGEPLALPAARALLERNDLRPWLETDAPFAAQLQTVEEAIDHLGSMGDAPDLRRLGLWSTAPGALGRRAQTARNRLQLLADRPDAVGGLALSAEAGGQLALAEAARAPEEKP